MILGEFLFRGFIREFIVLENADSKGFRPN
jgi:hypothetical protein